MRKEEHVLLVLTSHGGHCGFMEDVVPTGSGYGCKVFAQYVDAIFKHYSSEYDGENDTDENLNEEQNLDKLASNITNLH